MRTLVDIPEEDLTLMNTLSEAGHVSRAELVQRAVAAYLEPHNMAGRMRVSVSGAKALLMV